MTLYRSASQLVININSHFSWERVIRKLENSSYRAEVIGVRLYNTAFDVFECEEIVTETFP